MIAQQLLNGLFLGAVYALFAVGYTLIFGVLDILNLAHAAIFTAEAFVVVWFVVGSGVCAICGRLYADLWGVGHPQLGACGDFYGGGVRCVLVGCGGGAA